MLSKMFNQYVSLSLSLFSFILSNKKSIKYVLKLLKFQIFLTSPSSVPTTQARSQFFHQSCVSTRRHSRLNLSSSSPSSCSGSDRPHCKTCSISSWSILKRRLLWGTLSWELRSSSKSVTIQSWFNQQRYMANVEAGNVARTCRLINF